MRLLHALSLQQIELASSGLRADVACASEARVFEYELYKLRRRVVSVCVRHRWLILVVTTEHQRAHVQTA